jgi:hypothetical protein
VSDTTHPWLESDKRAPPTGSQTLSVKIKKDRDQGLVERAEAI